MDLDATLIAPSGVETWRLSDDDLLSLLPELSDRLRQLEALRARMAHETHERCLNQKVGASSTQAWLSGACRLTPAHAKRLLACGHSLRHRPELADAFATGVVDGEQVRAVTDLLVDAAATEHAGHTAARARALESMLDKSDGPEPDDENATLNEFHAATMPGGRVRVRGHFDKITGEQLLTALSALSKPRPGPATSDPDCGDDPRTPGQRRADAVTDIVRHYLDSGAAPGEGGERPHMTVFVSADDLGRATHTHTDRDASCCDDDRAEVPASMITRGPCWMPWTGAVSVTQAVMISCDATVTPIVMNTDGVPLDVGRTTRVIPRRIRRALDARDCGCTFPGCGRPAAWTDGHHIRHWSNGGETILSNLVLLCRYHHGLIHKGDWTVHIGDDGHPWFVPPSWIDPDRQPHPAHNRRHLVFTV